MGPARARRHPSGWLILVLGAGLALCSCQGDGNSETSDAETRSTMTDGEGASLDDVLANIQPVAPETVGDPGSLPPPDLTSFSFDDWAGALSAGSPESVSQALTELVLQGGSGGQPESASRTNRLRAGLRTPSMSGFLAEIQTDTRAETWEGANDKFEGKAEGSREITFDSENAEQSARLTVTGEGTLIATGAPTGFELEATWRHDLCWSENEQRDGEVEVTTVLRDESGEHTGSRFARATWASDGTLVVSWGMTVGGNTVVASGTSPDTLGPTGTTPTQSSSGDTTTYVWDNGYQIETSGPDGETIERLTEQVGDYHEFSSDVVSATPPINVTSGPGSSGYCLQAVVEPGTAVIEPGGETLGLTIVVTDWNGNPVQGAGVEVGLVHFGAITGPTDGFTSNNGELGTLYTSDKPGVEHLFPDVRYSTFRADPEGEIRVGEFWTFAMTVDVEDVTFLWDGVFAVGGGLIEGSGLGTVLGSGRCQITGSGTNYTGPLAEVSGTFTFDLAGTTGMDEDAEFFELLIDSELAELEFSYEDPNCGAFVDIAREFLKQVPTFPEFVPNVVVYVSDGSGTADVAIDPYIFEVEVAGPGSQPDG